MKLSTCILTAGFVASPVLLACDGPVAQAQERVEALFAEGFYQALVSTSPLSSLHFSHPDANTLEIKVIEAQPPLLIQLERRGAIEWQHESSGCVLDAIASSNTANERHTEAFLLQAGNCPEWGIGSEARLLTGAFSWVGE